MGRFGNLLDQVGLGRIHRGIRPRWGCPGDLWESAGDQRFFRHFCSCFLFLSCRDISFCVTLLAGRARIPTMLVLPLDPVVTQSEGGTHGESPSWLGAPQGGQEETADALEDPSSQVMVRPWWRCTLTSYGRRPPRRPARS